MSTHMKMDKEYSKAELYNLTAESWALWLAILNKHYNCATTSPKAKRAGDKIYARYERRYEKWHAAR